jgi:ActR/RegA family two-component response regulator
VFGIPHPSERTRLLEYGAEVSRLASDVKTRIVNLADEDHDIALEHFGKIEAVVEGFQVVVSVTMQQFLASYDGEARYGLKVCDSILRRRAAEPSIAADGLSELSKLVSEAIEAVLADDQLSPAAKELLVDRLSAVEEAIRRFRITGYAGVEKAVDALAGSTIRADEVRARPVVVDAISRVWRTMLNVAKGGNQLTITAKGALNLYQQIEGG